MLYFPRSLEVTDNQGQTRSVGEAGLLDIAGPKIVLGEPGMGKSELIRKLAQTLDVKPVTAIRLMHSKNPSTLVVTGKPLLIDGLDEAMSRRDGTSVDAILAQLEAAGSPDFILSCRVREWQSRTAVNLRQIYDIEPVLFTLQPLTRSEASSFLSHRFSMIDPEYVLSHLDEHRIDDLYRNPLTLDLMGRVARHDALLPATRAALFGRVCTLIWPEHDPDRQESGLGMITEDQALSAAGAISAGLLLAGAEAVSLAGPGQIQESDIRLADIDALPDAMAARVVFSSKLFVSVGPGRAKPIHRVIAEFLAARWLAQHATTNRARRRLLARLRGSGAVPASLRGLHAWLAFHSPAMAKEVIRADPFSMLRYGEVNNLTAESAGVMFDALQSLAEKDPYFRTLDWGSHTVNGLAVPSLQHKIKSTIASAASNEHLRSLLIETIKGTPLASELSSTLEKIALSTDRFYRERKDAAEALLPYRDRAWWQSTIGELHDQAAEDSLRLARDLIDEVDCDVSDQLLVAAVLAEMGATMCPFPRGKGYRIHTIFHFGRIVETLPVSRLISVLNLLSEHVDLFDLNVSRSAQDLAELTSLLILKAIEKQAISSADGALAWNWLAAVARADNFRDGAPKRLYETLDAHDDLRHAIQHHVLYTARSRPTIFATEFDLASRLVGLAGRPRDVTWFLNRLADTNNRDSAAREDWKDLMRLGFCRGGMDPEMREASRKFQASDEQLEIFVRKLANPKKLPWERKQERRAWKQRRKMQIAYETDRRYFESNRVQLCMGELAVMVSPAKAYLGLFRDLKREMPSERITAWLGGELAVDVMTGFDTVLHRSDLPSPEQVAFGFAESTIWNYCYPIMAGLLARVRDGDDLSRISHSVQKTALLLCLENHGMCNEDDVSSLREMLERNVISTSQERAAFARLWIEPSLDAGVSHIPGLYKLAHDERWQTIGALLAQEWLSSKEIKCKSTELALVDCLTQAGALTSLASIAAERADFVYDDFDHMLAWLAIDVLVRFNSVLPDLSNIGVHNTEFIWFLRDRFQLERRGDLLQITVAQAKWIVSEFRTQWPYAVLVGSGSGNTNPYDATEFLLANVTLIANDTSAAAGEAMQALVSADRDSYTDFFRHLAAEQHQKRAEEHFEALQPKELAEMLTEGPPSNVDDLKSLVLEEFEVAQKVLTGDDIDQVRDFWSDAGKPHDENRCRDRLVAIISPELKRYSVQRITEADMPQTKRADLAFAYGQIQLPMEVKGQWHPKVWQAASDQLDRSYLIDWRCESRGIYCVLWFGEVPFSSGRRLRPPPDGVRAPQSADEMRRMLIERIPEVQRSLIDVIVVDFTSGKPTSIGASLDRKS
jgi:hypothetical protein